MLIVLMNHVLLRRDGYVWDVVDDVDKKSYENLFQEGFQSISNILCLMISQAFFHIDFEPMISSFFLAHI